MDSQNIAQHNNQFANTNNRNSHVPTNPSSQSHTSSSIQNQRHSTNGNFYSNYNNHPNANMQQQRHSQQIQQQIYGSKNGMFHLISAHAVAGHKKMFGFFTFIIKKGELTLTIYFAPPQVLRFA